MNRSSYVSKDISTLSEIRTCSIHDCFVVLVVHQIVFHNGHFNQLLFCLKTHIFHFVKVLLEFLNLNFELTINLTKICAIFISWTKVFTSQPNNFVLKFTYFVFRKRNIKHASFLSFLSFSSFKHSHLISAFFYFVLCFLAKRGKINCFHDFRLNWLVLLLPGKISFKLSLRSLDWLGILLIELLVLDLDVVLLLLLEHISHIVRFQLLKEVFLSGHLFNSTSYLFFSAQMFMVHFVKFVMFKLWVFVLFLWTIFHERVVILCFERVLLFKFDLFFSMKTVLWLPEINRHFF